MELNLSSYFHYFPREMIYFQIKYRFNLSSTGKYFKKMS